MNSKPAHPRICGMFRCGILTQPYVLAAANARAKQMISDDRIVGSDDLRWKYQLYYDVLLQNSTKPNFFVLPPVLICL